MDDAVRRFDVGRHQIGLVHLGPSALDEDRDGALLHGLCLTRGQGLAGVHPTGHHVVGQDAGQLLTVLGLQKILDRFLTERNSAFGGARAGGNRPAGKAFTGGVQAGYSRTVVKSERHEAIAEIGYDFTFEDYVGDTDSLAIHSARVFAGYAGWAPGQLDAELRRDDWVVVPADREIVFGVDADAMWQAALDRLAVEL